MIMKISSKLRYKTRLIAISTIAIFALGTQKAIADEQFHVSADQIKFTNRGAYLKMRVWNCSEKPSPIQLADLPWGEHAIGLVIYAAGKREGMTLAESPIIADFPEREVVIPAKSSVSGEINLSTLFPTLSQYKSTSNLVVFWVYDKSLLKGGEANYVGGMLKMGLPIDDVLRATSDPCGK